MRTDEEIREYLNIGSYHDTTGNIIKLAKIAEEKYKEQLDSGEYGYGLMCDFESTPYVLEDEDIYEKLKEIENINGIIVYEKIERKQGDKNESNQN